MGDVSRIPTHIEGLDENMQGGIPEGHICIVAGASGAMKSSLTFSMLYNAVLYGETSGIYVTLEQGKDSLRSHMSNMGMNIDDKRVSNRIAIIDLSDLRVQLDEQGMSSRVDWMGQLIKQLTSYRDSIGFELLVFDSLGAFFTLTKMENPRDEIFRFYSALSLSLTPATWWWLCEQRTPRARVVSQTLSNALSSFGRLLNAPLFFFFFFVQKEAQRNRNKESRKTLLFCAKHTDEKIAKHA